MYTLYIYIIKAGLLILRPYWRDTYKAYYLQKLSFKIPDETIILVKLTVLSIQRIQGLYGRLWITVAPLPLVFPTVYCCSFCFSRHFNVSHLQRSLPPSSPSHLLTPILRSIPAYNDIFFTHISWLDSYCYCLCSFHITYSCVLFPSLF